MTNRTRRQVNPALYSPSSPHACPRRNSAAKSAGAAFFIDNLLVRIHFIIVMIGGYNASQYGRFFPP